MYHSPHPMVRHQPISTTSDQGFVVTYIAKSYDAPHQSLKPSLQYYIRAGSDFVPTPHAVLAGLFGRRRQPFFSAGGAVPGQNWSLFLQICKESSSIDSFKLAPQSLTEPLT